MQNKNHDKLILQVACPFCHHSLMDHQVKIKNLPSVQLKIRTEKGEKGTVYLCAAYECFEHQKDIDIKDKEIVNFCCPHCHQELLSNKTCQVCGAPMVELALDHGGSIRICSRKGCFNHFLSLREGLPS